jgi:hypothetical protein
MTKRRGENWKKKVMNFTATMSKPLCVDDKVGKRKGRIDFDAKSDESSNDASE